MATIVRNTGSHFRYDADDQLWHGKVRVASVSGDFERFFEYVAAFATLVELLSWISDIFTGLSAMTDTTVLGA